jgi:hypothetical protein
MRLEMKTLRGLEEGQSSNALEKNAERNQSGDFTGPAQRSH